MKNLIFLFTYSIVAIAIFPQSMVIQKTDGTNIFLDMSTIETINFIIPCPGTPTVDYAGKIYNTVLIGNQCWLKENLDVGTMITGSPSNDGIIEKYCYNNEPSNCATYGGLYQWNEAMQWVYTEAKGICPAGWHLPTLAEYQTLAATVGNDGNALKEIGQGVDPGEGTNTSGFSALLAGTRYSGNFYYLGIDAVFWISTEYNAGESNYFYLPYNLSNIIFDHNTKNYGFSVRCLKDQ